MVDTTIYLLPYALMTGVAWLAFYCGYRIEKKPKNKDDEITAAPGNCYAGYFEQLKALKAKDSREIALYTQRGQWYDMNQVLTMGLDIGRELTELGIPLPEVSLWDDGRRFRWVFEDEKSAFTFKMKFSSEIVDPPYEGFVTGE
jgi:hypothetical protein